MKWAHREGVLQVATGKKHQEEAICCVQRIRPYLNNKPVTLVTDNPENIPSGSFDNIVIHPEPKKPIEIKYCLY